MNRYQKAISRATNEIENCGGGRITILFDQYGGPFFEFQIDKKWIQLGCHLKKSMDTPELITFLTEILNERATCNSKILYYPMLEMKIE